MCKEAKPVHTSNPQFPFLRSCRDTPAGPRPSRLQMPAPAARARSRSSGSRRTPGRLGGGRTSPQLRPHTAGGALPSPQWGQCGRLPCGRFPTRAKRTGREGMRRVGRPTPGRARRVEWVRKGARSKTGPTASHHEGKMIGAAPWGSRAPLRGQPDQ